MSFVFSCKGQREMPKGGKIAPVDPCDDSLKWAYGNEGSEDLKRI